MSQVNNNIELISGDAFEEIQSLESGSINLIVTSPPYWGLRDYQEDDQFGLEETYEKYVDRLTEFGEEAMRVLTDDGSWFLNLGDTYNTYSIVREAGSQLKMQKGDEEYEEYHIKDKREENGNVRRKPVGDVGHQSKVLVPHRTAISLSESGWLVRNDIPWVKPGVGVDSATTRFRNRHEYFFWMTKTRNPYFEPEEVPHDVIEHPTSKFSGGHFATFPPEMVKPLIEMACPEDGVVLDPFAGSGSSLIAASRAGRRAIGIELSERFSSIARERIEEEGSEQ